MTTFKHINCADTAEKLANGECVIADIRDENSYNQAHIKESFHLTNGSISQFMQQVDEDKPVVVVCYHGRSSQGAAQYLVEQGFEDVYSMDGGFEAWRQSYPFASTDDQ
ncbi:thiosulfate sulfurtransferase GlpE [Saccharobesus litoralis]|uniref:Thiosulfate sulfurtransferase GlpE n=1 Tax=Saccharobesus litoralis TaxID=2172099 RepID=A0A2S0VWW0_9ALTE|nr:thiosulfate sulfurtransferase GlpE [Saccharobesus litoralis]AWB68662.1 thiosulfate sulfurtransferase GlpE [Saccharobesus litoralis]